MRLLLDKLNTAALPARHTHTASVEHRAASVSRSLPMLVLVLKPWFGQRASICMFLYVCVRCTGAGINLVLHLSDGCLASQTK